MARLPDDEDVRLGEVLFQIHRLGNAVKVSATDPLTNTEVSIMGSAYASTHVLEMNAIRKLRYVIAKKRREAGGLKA